MRLLKNVAPAARSLPAVDAQHPRPARWSQALITTFPTLRRLALAGAPIALIAYSVAYERAVPSEVLGSFPWWTNLTAYLAAAGALYTSKRFPLLAAVIAAICWWATGSALFVIAVTLLLGYRQPRGWLVYLIALSILHPMAIVPDPLSFVTGQVLLPSWSVPLYSCFLSALIGAALRTAHNTALERERQLERSVAEAEARAELAVAEDRLRMSREMHDILGHQLSTMVLLSTALVAQPDTARAKSIAERIADNGHQAIDDLQYVLRLLDSPRTEMDPDRPTPMQRIRDAVESAEHVGHEVRLTDPLDLTDAGQDLELGVDAIVEAVHNAMKHAPGASIDISAASAPEALHIVVTNGSAPRPAPEHPLGTGRGLRLLAARTTAAGGTFAAGGTDDGGYRLSLEVPR
ncbi:sensor histidine kinase [Plantibacter sp. YIM 135347]|uniref:sensor histidine kinase n=1 Tax=Plantibacter sp. YIM 135347 TaxID=3423919 RepID=UPI003D32795C